MAARSALWTAVYALREAEALAGLGLVAGPADEPPAATATDVEQANWYEDWIARAKATLVKAKQMHDEALRKGYGALQERAKKVADRIVQGTRALAAGAKAVAKKVGKPLEHQLDELHKDARAIAYGWTATQVALALAAGVVLITYLRKGM